MAQANGEESKSDRRVRELGVWASLQLPITQRHFQETQVTLGRYDMERFSNYFLMIITNPISG